MEETARFRIEYDPDIKEDDIEIKKRSSNDYVIRVGDVDLEKDDKTRELFADRFNSAYRDQDFETGNAIDPESRLHRVQMRRLGEAITKGETKFNFKIPKSS